MVLLFCEWFCSIVPQSRAQKKGAHPLPCSGPPAHTAVDRYGILDVVGRGAVVSPCPGRDQNVFPALHLGQTGKAEPCLPGVTGLTAQDPATVQLCAVQLAQQGAVHREPLRVAVGGRNGIPLRGKQLAEGLLLSAGPYPAR